MSDNGQVFSGTSLVRCKTGFYVPQQAPSVCVSSSQENPMNKHIVISSQALEELHSGSSNSLPSGNRSCRRLREFIPDNKKDSDYWMKRQKNNEAAKRSREKRRLNDVIMGRQIVQLMNENKRLRMELDTIRRTYGSPPPPPLPPPVDMLYNVDSSYCIGNTADEGKNLLLSPECNTVSASNTVTSLSCSSFAYMPIESSCMPVCCDLQSYGGILPGGVGKTVSFEERENLIGTTSVSTGSLRSLHSFEEDKYQQLQVEALNPVVYGSDGSRTLSLANPTSCTSSPKYCMAVSSALEPHDEATGSQVDGRMPPPLVMHTNCFQTTVSQSYLDTEMRQENNTSGQGTFQSLASRRHQVELALLFSDVSSSDENEDEIVTDVYQFQSLEEKPLNLSTKTGFGPFREGQALPLNRRNAEFVSECQGSAAPKSRMLPVVGNWEQATSAINLPTSLSCLYRNGNVSLKSSSKIEPQSPVVPHISSSFLLPSPDEGPEKKRVTEKLQMADSYLDGNSCVQNFHFTAFQRNLIAPIHETYDERETWSPAGLSRRRISGSEVYTFLPLDLVENAAKAVEDAGETLGRPVHGGVPLKLWHKWSSSCSEKVKVTVEGREHDACGADGPIGFHE